MSRQIGRYQVQAELGRGGFGRVFRAYDPTVGRQVAIKTLTASDEPDMLKRFRNEASAAGKLRHPNIVVIHDFGEQDGTPFLVMELLEGEDVERIINNRRDLSLARRLDILMKAADGLHHAHSQGIVHRDIKPANIMVLADGNVKILDFGIALLSQATAARFTPQGSVIGTLPYMAPEQLRGSVSDVLTDIFAYGVTLYRLVTGTHPFDAAEAGALMYNIINKTPAPVRQFLPQAPEALEHVVAKLLDKDRETRYQTLEDVHFDLEPILQALRKENVGGLLAEARTLLAADRLDTAQAVVRQIIEIDPANRTARELREQLQRQIREREIRPRVASLLGTGRDELSACQFDAAIHKFESALRIDKSNPELRALLGQARAEWESAKRADRLLDEARQALRVEDLTAAHHRIGEALSADPGNPDAPALLETIRQSLEARRQKELLREGLKQVKTLMLSGSYTEAVQAAARLCEGHPESAEAGQLREKALRERDAQERRRQLTIGIEAVKDSLRGRRFAQAQKRLSLLSERFPDAVELHELKSQAADGIRAQNEVELVARATADTERLVAAKQFDRALNQLRSLLTEHPSLTALRDLVQSVTARKMEHQRNSALADVLEKCAAHAADGRFAEVLQEIGAFVSAHGDHPALQPLRSQAEAALERQRRESAGRQVLLNAQRRIDAGDPIPAIAILQRGLAQFPDDRELTALLETARHNQRMQEQVEAIDLPRAQPLEQRPPKRLPWTKLIAGACAAVGLTAGITIVARGPQVPKPVALHANEPARALDLTLQPIVVPPPLDNGLHRTATGILLVQAGVADTVVLVDGAARGRTDSSGSLSLTLEVKPHEIRVEHTGYKPVAAQRIEVVEGARRNAAFTLVRKSAKLELRGAPAGVAVSAGGKLLGRTNGSPAFLFAVEVPEGDSTIQLTAGNLKLTAQRRFESGQTLHLEWKDVAPPPPTANAEALDNKDWELARNSTDIARLRDYLRAHPNGAHTREADKRIADLAWSAVDPATIDAVRKFARENPGNPHLPEAQKIIDQFDAEQQRLAQERARQEQAAQERARQELAAQAQKEQDRVKEESRRKQAVLDALKQFDSAMQHKRVRDVKAVWPTATQLFLDSLGNSHVKMSLDPRAEDIRFLDGVDRALVECDLTTTIDAAPRHQKVLLTLRHAGAAWTIEGAKFQ